MATRRPRARATASTHPTPRQLEYLEFIRAFTKRWGVPPSFEEIAQHFLTTAPSVNGMIKTLEAKGFLARIPGQARTLRVILPEEPLSPAKPLSARKIAENAENAEVASLTRLAAMVVERLVPAVGKEDLQKLSIALNAVAEALDIATTMAGASDKQRKEARESLVQVAVSAQGQAPYVGKPRRTWAPIGNGRAR